MGFIKTFRFNCLVMHFNSAPLPPPQAPPSPTATEPANNKYLISHPHPSLYQRRAHLAGNMRNYTLWFHLKGGGRGTQPFPGEYENVVNFEQTFLNKNLSLGTKPVVLFLVE